MSNSALSITKISDGNYLVDIANVGRFSLFRYDEGTYKGWWMYQADFNRHIYSDPVKTKREALAQLQAAYAPATEGASFKLCE